MDVGGCSYRVRAGRVYGWVYQGGVYRGGYQGGLYRCTQPPARGGPSDSEAGPVGPCQGAGVGGHWGRAYWASGDHPCGARSDPWSSLSPPRANAASWPIAARLSVIFSKVSQNGQVSSRSVNKACHSPCSQNWLRKSPLGILRFLFRPAFSHKELMDVF